MCNPLSGDPDDALEPWTPNGTGERLWRMVNYASPISRDDYARQFFRINLVVDSRKYSSWRARARAAEIRLRIGASPAVVLGRETWRALGLPADAEWFSSCRNWHLVPHPSGKNLSYNELANRVKTGRLVAALGGLT